MVFKAILQSLNEETGAATLVLDPSATLVGLDTLRRLVALLERGSWTSEQGQCRLCLRDCDYHADDCELQALRGLLEGLVGG